jgi:CRP-like cAMP-binding protein
MLKHLADVSPSDADGVVEHQEVLVEEEQQAGDGLQHRQGHTQLFKEKRATLAAVQGELQRALVQKQKNNANQNVPEKSPKDAKLKHQQRPHTNEIMTEKSSHDARLKQKHQLEQQKSPAHHLHGGRQKKGEVSPLLQIAMTGSKTKGGEVSPSLHTPRTGMRPSSPLGSAGGNGSESRSSSVSPLKITGGSCGQGIGGSPLLSSNHVKSKAEIRPNQEDRSTVSLGRDLNSNTNAAAKRPAKHEVAQKQRLTPTGGSASTCSTPSARKTHSEMAAASSREVANTNTESFASTVEILDRSKATFYGEAKEAVLNSFLKMAPQIKLFKGVDTRLIQSLTSRLSVIQCARNTTIIDAGTEGHSMFFLITGECHVYLAGKMVAKLQAPCSFGEIALLLGRRSAEVRSSSACIFCELESTHMWEVLNEFPLALETISLTLKALAWEQVNKNKHEMFKVETHSSAIREYQDPLTQLNLSDRHQRILAWHRHYESMDSGPSDIPIVRRSPSGAGRTPSAESASDVRGRFDSAVDQAIGHLDPIQIALEISGVSKHVVSIIQSMKMFEGAPVRAQAQVIAKLVTVNFSKGDVVIQAGTSGTCMYFVDEGRLEVIVDNKRVQEQVSGCFFGEIALLTRQKRTATVVALEDCKLLQLDQDAVWTVFNMFPSMYTTIKTVAAQRLDAGIDQISRESALTSSKIKRKGLAGTRSFRVKFRAPFDRFTPEELGASKRSYFVAGLPKVTFFPGKDSTKFANKKAVYFFTVSEASEIIYKSQLISFVNDGPRELIWQDKDPIRKRFVGTPTSDGSGYQLRNLTFCIFLLNKSMLGSFLKPQLLCKAEIELSSVISTPNRKLTLSLPMFTEALSPRKGSVESVMAPKSPVPQNRPMSPTSANGRLKTHNGNLIVFLHALCRICHRAASCCSADFLQCRTAFFWNLSAMCT